MGVEAKNDVEYRVMLYSGELRIARRLRK